MKIILSFILVIATHHLGVCQFNGSIIYNNDNKPVKIFVAINDSSSFTSYTSLREAALKKDKQVGDKFRSHNTYQNKNQNLLLFQSHLDGKTKYLVYDSLPKWEWHLVDTSKTILGYQCKKAVLRRNNSTIIAWYAPSLPTNLGPMDFNGLPGLILELYDLSYNNTNTATQISFEPINIVAPTKGKRISQEAFRKVKASR